MTALIVGEDYVENLKREIVAHGHSNVEHWIGRRSGFARRAVPEHARLIVVLCDYVNATLLVRDVETEQDMAAAVRAGADVLLGRYLAEPTLAVGSLSHGAREQASHPGCAW